jgi:hypothetical protein
MRVLVVWEVAKCTTVEDFNINEDDKGEKVLRNASHMCAKALTTKHARTHARTCTTLLPMRSENERCVSACREQDMAPSQTRSYPELCELLSNSIIDSVSLHEPTWIYSQLCARILYLCR